MNCQLLYNEACISNFTRQAYSRRFKRNDFQPTYRTFSTTKNGSNNAKDENNEVEIEEKDKDEKDEVKKAHGDENILASGNISYYRHEKFACDIYLVGKSGLCRGERASR